MLSPALTTVSFPAEKMGSAAAGLLLDMIEKKVSRQNQRIIISPELVVRESCAPAAIKVGKCRVPSSQEIEL